jgi:tellurite resistance protein TerC
MLASAPISYWIGFHALVLVLLAIDLFFLGNKNEKTAQKLAVGWTIILACFAGCFALWLLRVDGRQHSLEFFSGYLIETSLSVDNLFVFLIMFRSLHLSRHQQRNILLWGVIGAILMRALFIAAGVSLLARFSWIEYVFGVILLVAAVRLMRPEGPHGKPSAMVQWIQRQSLSKPGSKTGVEGTRTHPALEPVSSKTGSHHLALNTKTFLMIIIAVEATDLVFALDSIPAVLAITRDPFIAYTSNIFAVLGLRSLFFALSGMLDRFRLLHYGLGVILAFVAVKMLLSRWVHVNVGVSLAVIVGILAIFIVASLVDEKRRSRIASLTPR